MTNWPLRVMIYGAGEAINGAGALAPEIQGQLSRLSLVATSSRVAAVAQLDSTAAPTLRFVLDPSGRQPVHQIPNVNVGDPVALLDFVSWGIRICPADNSILVLSGHGAAWEDSLVEQMFDGQRGFEYLPRINGALRHARSIFRTEASIVNRTNRAVLVNGQYRDYLSNAELGAVCTRIRDIMGRKIGTLVFDACLMSSWEILNELGDSTETVIAAVDELSASGIDLSAAVARLNEGGDFNSQEIASLISNTFEPQAPFDSCVAINLTAPNWDKSIESFSSFSQQFFRWIRSTPSNAQLAREILRTAGARFVKFANGSLADVGALAEAVRTAPTMPSEIVSTISVAAKELSQCVLGRSFGADYESALGISIFCPSSLSAYSSNRPDYSRLPFAVQTGWAKTLDALYFSE